MRQRATISIAFATAAVVCAALAGVQWSALPSAARGEAWSLLRTAAWLPAAYGLIWPFVGRVSWERDVDRGEVFRAVLVAVIGVAFTALTVALVHPPTSSARTLPAVVTDPPSRFAFLGSFAAFAGVYAAARPIADAVRSRRKSAA